MNAVRLGHGGCAAPPVGERLLGKVSPMPIGLDLHTFGEKAAQAARRLGEPQLRCSTPCQQVVELRAARSAGPEWPGRRACVGVASGTEFETRIELEAVVQVAMERDEPEGSSDLCVQRLSTDRTQMWRAAASLKFVFAPSGHGIDTHRFWELLDLGVVPVTVSSSLDGLYSRYPSVLLGSWSEVLEPGAIGRWILDIQMRFGADPFSDGQIQRMLSADYWAEAVRNATL